MKYVMDVPGLWETELVYHWRYFLNDLKGSESPGRKLAHHFQMQIVGVQPDLIANFELFIGKSRLPRDHRFLRPLMRDYRFVPICCQLLQSFFCKARGIGHIRRVRGRFVAMEEIERSLSMRAMNPRIVSELRICQI